MLRYAALLQHGGLVSRATNRGLREDSWNAIRETRFEHTFMRPPALLTTIQTVNNEKGLPSNSRPWLTVARKILAVVGH